MDTQQITRILLADTYVRRLQIRVCARDQLPNHLDRTRPTAFVVNTDPSDKPGSHWIAVYYDGAGKCEYFDSFGLPPLHAELLKFIEKHSDTALMYNTRILQDVLSDACGLYAIYFIMMKGRGASMTRLLQPFSTKQRVNDRVVGRLVTPYVQQAQRSVSRLT